MSYVKNGTMLWSMNYLESADIVCDVFGRLGIHRQVFISTLTMDSEAFYAPLSFCFNDFSVPPPVKCLTSNLPIIKLLT